MSTTTASNPTSKDYLNQLYDAQNESAKEQLTQAYNESASELDSESEKLKKQRQKELVQTDVEAQRARKNYAEVQNAYGLSSGAMAQARLAQDNQHQNDMTDIRTAYMDADADVERRRTLLAQQYASAIKEAQANNDLARAQALYELAREEDANLLAQQQAAGGSYSGSGGSGGSGEDPAPEANSTTPMVNTGGLISAVGDYISGAIGDAANGLGSVPTPVQTAEPTISAQDYLNAAGVGGSSAGTHKKPTATESQNYTVDMSSINGLGRGTISEAELNRLIAAGEVEEYIVGNTIRFRNASKKTGGGASGVSDPRMDPRFAVSARA